MSKKYDVCILGATGAVGEAMLAILEQRNFRSASCTRWRPAALPVPR